MEILKLIFIWLRCCLADVHIMIHAPYVMLSIVSQRHA